MQVQNVDYRWPSMAPVRRQYVVVDDRGRFGVAYSSEADQLWARPIGQPAERGASPEMALPGNAIVMTSTLFKLQPDGTYRGVWFDYNGPSHIPDNLQHHLTVVDDLGYLMPDQWADIALAGSDEAGHWNYGATLGKVGGEPPVKGQNPYEMTTEQAEDYAREVGESVTRRGIRLAARNGYIPGSRKVGRDWLIPYDGFNHYLDNRPKPGRK